MVFGGSGIFAGGAGWSGTVDTDDLTGENASWFGCGGSVEWRGDGRSGPRGGRGEGRRACGLGKRLFLPADSAAGPYSS